MLLLGELGDWTGAESSLQKIVTPHYEVSSSKIPSSEEIICERSIYALTE